MSKESFERSYENAKRYFKENYSDRGGILFDRNGFFADVPTETRTYTIFCFVDEKADLVYMEVCAGIQVGKPYIAQVSSYLNNINGERKCSGIKLHPNGVMYSHAEQDIEDEPVSLEVIHNMEIRCLGLLEIFGDVLDKLAHGILLEPDELDHEKVEDKYARKKYLELKELREEYENDDDDDDDLDFDFELDDDDDDDGELSLAETRRINAEISKRIMEEVERRNGILADDDNLAIAPDMEFTADDFDEEFLAALEEENLIGSDDDDDDE